MDTDALLKEDTFLKKYPLITSFPKEFITNNRIIRQYQGYISANVCFAAYGNEMVPIDEEISISIPDGYPSNLPMVYLLSKGHSINYGVDYHFYQDTGQLCLGQNWEIRKELFKDASLLNLVESLIIPHLAAMRYVSKNPNKGYPQGEYSHGPKGLIEGLSEHFDIPQTPEAILNVLQFLSNSRKVANKTICPFGCGNKYGSCQCKGNIKELQMLIPPKEAVFMINMINTAIFSARLNTVSRKFSKPMKIPPCKIKK